MMLTYSILVNAIFRQAEGMVACLIQKNEGYNQSTVTRPGDRMTTFKVLLPDLESDQSRHASSSSSNTVTFSDNTFDPPFLHQA